MASSFKGLLTLELYINVTICKQINNEDMSAHTIIVICFALEPTSYFTNTNINSFKIYEGIWLIQKSLLAQTGLFRVRLG